MRTGVSSGISMPCSVQRDTRRAAYALRREALGMRVRHKERRDDALAERPLQPLAPARHARLNVLVFIHLVGNADAIDGRQLFWLPLCGDLIAEAAAAARKAAAVRRP